MLSTRPADTAYTRCDYYRRICALPARVDPDTHQITFRAGPIWAITAPSAFGQRVKAELSRRTITEGPVIAHPYRPSGTAVLEAIRTVVAHEETCLR